MADPYVKFQKTADRLLTKWQQGTVSLKRVTSTPGANEWDPPTETVTSYALKAAVRRVSQKYVDGTLILATDNQITFAVPAVTPLMTDTLVVDGKDHAMKDLRPLPGAGTVAAYIAFIAA
jgi:hypothetical protein